MKIAIVLLCLLAPAEIPGKRLVETRGNWVVDATGRPIGPDSFRRGLQPSGLLWRKGELWSVGDQRSQFPGHIFRIEAGSGRLSGPPVRLTLPAPRAGENPAYAVYRKIPNSDFEGVVLHPGKPDVLLAVTEDKVPWIVEIHLETGDDGSVSTATISQLSEIRFPAGLRPWRDSPNFRIEGLAIADDASTLYLAYERADDDLPRLYRTTLEACSGVPIVLEPLRVAFDKVPPRADKGGARLNLNDIQFLRWKGTAYLLGVARDQERLLLIDPSKGHVVRWIDLDLRDPDGNSIHWVSPEGLAFDLATDRLWIINDPDSVRGNYRRRDTEKASGEYAEYAPLLFELKLSDVMEDDHARG